MNISVTAAKKADCKALADISARAFSQPMSEKEFERELDVNFSRTLAAFLDGETAGFINIWIVGGNADLNNIAVKKEYRRMGLGQMLLDSALALCKECESMTLEVRVSNTAAIAFYKKNGFELIGRRRDFYSYPTEDALIYRREI